MFLGILWDFDGAEEGVSLRKKEHKENWIAAHDSFICVNLIAFFYSCVKIFTIDIMK